jgi:hypothetical protein
VAAGEVTPSQARLTALGVVSKNLAVDLFQQSLQSIIVKELEPLE